MEKKRPEPEQISIFISMSNKDDRYKDSRFFPVTMTRKMALETMEDMMKELSRRFPDE